MKAQIVTPPAPVVVQAPPPPIIIPQPSVVTIPLETPPQIKKDEFDLDDADFSIALSSNEANHGTNDCGGKKEDEIDLDSIDMMQLPIQLDDGIDLLDEVK